MYVRGDGMSQDQQDMMNLLAKAICYCKVFLPTETVIKPRPAMITAYPEWSSEIRALGIKAERAMMHAAHCRAYSTNRKAEKTVCTRLCEALKEVAKDHFSYCLHS